MSCEACCLVRVSVNEADSPFHAMTRIPWIIDASTVLMMSMDKCVDEAHHHDPTLEAS